MYICICRQITDKDIHNAIAEGCCNSLRDVCKKFELGKQCGKCCYQAREVVVDALKQQQWVQVAHQGTVGV